MNRFKYLLFFAALLLLIGAAHGQISYTSAVSAQRLNYYYSIYQGFEPKTMCIPDNPDYIITLAHEIGNTNTLLFLTQEGTNTVNVARISNYLITDFDIFHTNIVFCGETSTTSSPVQSIGVEDYMTLFSANSQLNILEFPLANISGNLQKIRAYQDDGTMKIAAIMDSIYFLDIDWTNQTVDAFETQYKLNDIIVTETYVTALGTVSELKCMLFTHNKFDMQNYNGNMFRTKHRYQNTRYLIEEMPGYDLYENFSNGNQAIIGLVNEDLTDEFGIIDLNTLSVLSDFAVDSGLLRHSITDLCHDNDNQMIHCLSRDNIFKDYIYQPYPYTDTLTAVFPLDTVPLMKYQLKTITPHYNYFTTAGTCFGYGSNFNNSVYWFDAQIGNYSSSCLTTKPLTEKVSNFIYKIESVSYDNTFNISLSPNILQSQLIYDFYSYECQY
ncbi:MAG: hypothetical protein J6M30_06870 [Bacteroidales bacterium]|nr:hypothetical protein [Bacteroidales bacterium]